MKRLYRIWDEKAKKDLRWRYYSDKASAVNKGLVLSYRDLELGNAYTVYNIQSGRTVHQFAKRITNHQVHIVELK